MKFIYTLLFFLSAFVSILPASAQTTFWNKKAGPYGGTVTDVEYDPARSMTYAIVENRFFYSTDDGTTWQKNTAITSLLYDIEIGDNGTVYLSDGSAIYRSTNGIDFTKVTTNFVLSGGYKIRRISNGGGTIVALAFSRLYFSTDDGVTFTQGASGTFKTSYFAVGPGVSGGQGVYMLDNTTSMPRRSTNGGVSLETPTNTNLTGPCYSLSSRNEKSQIFVVNQTGIFSATNGDTWTAIKGGSIADTNIAGASNGSFIEFSADGKGMYFIDNLNYKMHYKAPAGASTTWVQSTAFPGGSGNNIFNASAKTLDPASPGSSIALFGNFRGLTKTVTGTSSFVANANIGIEMGNPRQIMSTSGGNLLVFSTNLGLQYSNDRGLTWLRSSTTPAGDINMMTGVSTASVRNQTVLALNSSNAVFKTTSGSSYTAVTTPTTFRWIQGANFNRVFALSNTAAPAWYYSNDTGTTWSPAITITGLPTSYNINDLEHVNVYSLTTSSAVVFFKLFSNTPANGTEFWKITFTIGTGVTISGVASKVAFTGTPFTTNIPTYSTAKNGKFFVFTDAPNPDAYAFSADNGASWTNVNSPGNSGKMIVADNGYVFLGTNQGKLYYSRDDGANFIETTFPAGTNLTNIFDIVDIHIDTKDFAQTILYQGSLHSSLDAIALPASPTALSVLGKTATSVSLAWTDNSYNETFYKVERSSNGGTSYTNVGDVAASDICTAPANRGYFVDTGLSPSTSYLYRVTTVNSAGSSTSSVTASTTTLAATTQNIPDGRSWTAINTGGNGYAVGSPKTVGIRHIGGGLYEISDVAIGTFDTDYKETFYETGGQTMLVGTNNDRSIRPNGMGTWNGTNVLTLKWKKCSEDKFETITLTLTTPQTSDPAPTVPAVAQSLIVATNSIEVSWSGAFYAKDYIVERSLNGTSGWAQVGSNVNAPATKLLDPGPFVEGTSYFYRVRARNINAVASTNSNVPTVVYKKPNLVLSANSGIEALVSGTLGMYAGDFNNDGLDDVFTIDNTLGTSTTSHPVIYVNQGGGIFKIVNPVMAPEVYWLSSLADINNDGNLDIGLSAQGATQFDVYYGNGDLTFTKATAAQLGELANISIVPFSHSWADFNKDGRVDVLLCGNGDIHLFKQTATGTFVRAPGGDLALDTDAEDMGTWADYDNDGDVDLLITQRNDPWRLYQNNGDETFTNKTTASGLANLFGYTGPWGDYNNDGKLDLFVGDSNENALFKNNGDGTFTKEPATSLSTATSTFANMWGDLNNDGLIDLLSPNIAGISSMATRLAINTTTGANASFQVTTSEKVSDIRVGSFGGAVLDVDNNGFLDFVPSIFGVADGFGPAAQELFMNNNTTGNWIEVKLKGVTSNKLGIGAQVTVVANGKTQYREVFSGTAVGSQSSFTQHFGIGSATSITSLKVRWPSGILQTMANPTINQILTITEDGTGPVVSTYSPANDATGVSTHASLEITFNETPVPVAGKKLTITASGDASATYTIDMSAGTVNASKLTFALPGRLLGGKRYDLALEAGAVTDVYQNASLAISSGWGFTTAAGPAVSALSPANAATNAAVNAALEITFDKTVLAVAGKKIKVTGNTATLFDADVATGTINGSKFSIAAPTAGWPYLTSLTVTLEAGAFTDESGNDTEAISGTTWSFTTVETPDVTPPSFPDMSVLPSTVDKATLMTSLTVSITDNKSVATAKLFFKAASAATFTENAGAPGTGTNWTFSFPASGFDATGTQYYFVATDASNNSTRMPATGSYQTLIKYKGNDSQIPASLLGSGGQVSGWKVIAIPFDLGINNGVKTAFNEMDDKIIKEDWRLITLNPEHKEWLDYPAAFNTLNRGVGYFINIVTPPAIIIGDNLVAPNNTRDNLFKMTLKKGWNMVGNPYLEAIDWANVTALNNLTGTAAVFKKFSGGTYSNTGTLAAYEGGFVQVPADMTVSIPFMGQTTSSRMGQPEFGPDEWLLPIILKQGELTNTFGGVGMHSKASASFDELDDINGPRWFEFSEMNFKHPEHFAKEFARDVVPVASQYDWEFNVDSNLPQTGTLTWDTESYSIEKDIYLYDVATQTPINMRENNSYEFDPKVSRTFKIFYGNNALARIKPARVMLGAAYPNPTSKMTTIPFTVPDQKGNMRIRLEVFDMTGKSVGTLANGEFAPGFYRGEWQPMEGQSDGLYFYRLLAGEEVLTGKVVLKK
ncbi:MAG TPA: FG-GAP-like repeat-containing protein [Cyclobacteriaceae bacterium]|nr:FG-GAP-like repeat-containing protein [Cyclobacteriaceae bacterium]